jgi:hypothetical protein
MARKLLAGAVVAAALAAALRAVGPAAADQLPVLRAAKAVHRHVVLSILVGDERPAELLVAKKRAVNLEGALLSANVRTRETITLPASASGVVSWQSQTTLRPGVYFVQIEAFETGGVTDCPPKQMHCGEQWSNIRRVAVPK